MSNRIFIFVAITVTCGLCVSIVLFLLSQHTSQPVTPPSSLTPTSTQPTATPTRQVAIAHEMIVTSSPQNQATNVTLATPLTVTLPDAIAQNEIYFSITPATPYTIQETNNQYTITFTQPLQPNTLYIYFIGKREQNTYESGSFTTLSDPQVSPVDNIPLLNQALNLHKHPDGFLRDKTPYRTSDFSITASVAGSPSEHFAFTVTLLSTDKNAAKQAFMTWALSLGLNQTQIDNLDITYQ